MPADPIRQRILLEAERAIKDVGNPLYVSPEEVDSLPIGDLHKEAAKILINETRRQYDSFGADSEEMQKSAWSKAYSRFCKPTREAKFS